jgi:hypothetical protein
MFACLVPPAVRTDGRTTLRIRFDPTAPPSPESAAELAALVRDWFGVADKGAFCAANAAPESSSIAIVTHPVPHALEVTWELDLHSVDARCWRVLRNDLYAFSRIVTPLESMALAQPGGPDTGHLISLPAIAPAHSHAAYPPASKHLPFSVDRPPLPRGAASRRAIIQFGSDLSSNDARLLGELIEQWSMVAFCGYPMSEADLENGRCAIFNSETDQLDERTLEVAIDDFGGSEAAWNPLLNLFGRASVAGTRVSAVSIE